MVENKLPMFAHGQRVYSGSGQVGQFLQYINVYSRTSYLVQTIMRGYRDDEPETLGNVETWPDAFLEPPRVLYDKTIEELTDKKAGLLAEIASITARQANLQQEEKQRLARLKQHEGLGLLEDFIDGKITHLVVDHYDDITIQSAAVESEDKRPAGLRLLSLYGDTKGDLSWRVSAYEGHHGGEKNIVPARSFEEARTIARARIDSQIAKLQAKPQAWQARPWDLHKVISNSERFGIELPMEMQAAWQARKVEDARKAVQECEQKLSVARAQLSSVDPVSATPTPNS